MLLQIWGFIGLHYRPPLFERRSVCQGQGRRAGAHHELLWLEAGVRRPGQRDQDAAEPRQVHRGVYGNFDIIFGPFLAHSQLQPTRTVRVPSRGLVIAEWELIGA